MKPWENFKITTNGSTVKDNFAGWFGKSKVVDDNGIPVLVYHGTNADFDTFEVGEHGAFFTSLPGAACAYALGEDDDGVEVRDGANVRAVYLSLQNPLIVTDEWLSNFSSKAPPDPFARGHDFRDDFVDSETYARDGVIAEAKRLGHDGLILPSDMLPVESMNGDWDEQPAFTAFFPEQIKSATGNSGLYSKQASLCDESTDQPDSHLARVRISDIVPHESPNPKRVATIVKAIKAGDPLPPITIDRNPCKHWTQGPKGMECIGYGFGVIDGHHRLEAYKQVFGPNHTLEVELHRQPVARISHKGPSI